VQQSWVNFDFALNDRESSKPLLFLDWAVAGKCPFHLQRSDGLLLSSPGLHRLAGGAMTERES